MANEEGRSLISAYAGIARGAVKQPVTEAVRKHRIVVNRKLRRRGY